MEKTFDQIGTFAANDAAESWLIERGFSIGRMQQGAPRGILLGDYDIQKWRNLSPQDRDELAGTMTGDFRNGPVHVSLKEPQGDQ